MTEARKVLVIFGTRPEAIKLAPVIMELKKTPNFLSKVCVTAQHREMLDQVLKLFGIEPDIDLDIMKPGQTLAEVTAKVVMGIDEVLLREKPDVVLIQGDTTTVMATALAAFYRGVKIGHVEAGLRSGNVYSPFPEEVNRRVVSLVGTFHFAPTRLAYETLKKEGVGEGSVFLTGNPVIDAFKMIANTPMPEGARKLLYMARFDRASDGRKLILVTAHRRENFGKRFESICEGIKRVVLRNKNVYVIYPVHLNPNVQEPVHRILGGVEGVILTRPVEYHVLVHLIKHSYLVLTDSGGIQEEAPSLGKPVLVMREETERPEGIEAGTAKLIGPNSDRIVEETENLLYDQKAYEAMSKAVNPYGDGFAATRIVEILRRKL